MPPKLYSLFMFTRDGERGLRRGILCLLNRSGGKRIWRRHKSHGHCDGALFNCVPVVKKKEKDSCTDIFLKQSSSQRRFKLISLSAGALPRDNRGEAQKFSNLRHHKHATLRLLMLSIVRIIFFNSRSPNERSMLSARRITICSGDGEERRVVLICKIVKFHRRRNGKRVSINGRF